MHLEANYYIIHEYYVAYLAKFWRWLARYLIF